MMKRDKINCLSIFQGLYLNVPNSLTQLTLDNLNIQKSQAPLKVKPLPKAFNKPNSLTGSFWAKPIEQNLYLITWLCCPVVLQILSYWEWAVAAPMLEIYPQSGLPKKIISGCICTVEQKATILLPWWIDCEINL